MKGGWKAQISNDSLVINNVAKFLGGGMAVNKGSSVRISSTQFTGNAQQGYVQGENSFGCRTAGPDVDFRMSYSLFFLSRTSIYRESCTHLPFVGGGGLFFYASIIQVQDDTRFDSNMACAGGAISSYLYEPFHLIIEGKNINFINNSAIGKPIPHCFSWGDQKGGRRRRG